MPGIQPPLPQSGSRPFVTDGGLETWLVFQQGIDLPCFAAVPLVSATEGRAVLEKYYRPYFELARRYRTGIVLDAPTWRANRDWGEKLGYAPRELFELNRAALAFVARLGREEGGSSGIPVALNGVVGPRGDGYRVESLMSAAEAQDYHGLQVAAFADGGADMVSAVTMTHVDEAVGIALAAKAFGLPAVISFTVETDGRLPSGDDLGAAVAEVDRRTDAYPAYYMVNCAHPSHFEHVLEAGAAWLDRIGGLRANASAKSHAELDAATELDAGDPQALARDYALLRSRLKHLCVVGGCCGTDHRHVAAICDACLV
ncbi:homocysteine S-methyltransferase family protein [Enterovirga sp. CN4-39]|uniref:homocysteine S-methyltransferase family protein n=1 Tax=Enterovirga sp. CN4-39 TaxID=3400910 RepID=UPI003BFC8730